MVLGQGQRSLLSQLPTARGMGAGEPLLSALWKVDTSHLCSCWAPSKGRKPSCAGPSAQLWGVGPAGLVGCQVPEDSWTRLGVPERLSQRLPAWEQAGGALEGGAPPAQDTHPGHLPQGLEGPWFHHAGTTPCQPGDGHQGGWGRPKLHLSHFPGSLPQGTTPNLTATLAARLCPCQF